MRHKCCFFARGLNGHKGHSADLLFVICDLTHTHISRSNKKLKISLTNSSYMGSVLDWRAQTRNLFHDYRRKTSLRVRIYNKQAIIVHVNMCMGRPGFSAPHAHTRRYGGLSQKHGAAHSVEVSAQQCIHSGLTHLARQAGLFLRACLPRQSSKRLGRRAFASNSSKIFCAPCSQRSRRAGASNQNSFVLGWQQREQQQRNQTKEASIATSTPALATQLEMLR